MWIYVCNLAAYNNGTSIGDWINLDTCSDADELQDKIHATIADRHGVYIGEEWRISDYECVISGVEIDEYMPTPQVWELYEMVSQFDESDWGPLSEYIDIHHGDVEYACRTFHDAYYGEADNLDEFAHSYLDDSGTPFVHLDGSAVSWNDIISFLIDVGMHVPDVDEPAWSDFQVSDGYVFRIV